MFQYLYLHPCADTCLLPCTDRTAAFTPPCMHQSDSAHPANTGYYALQPQQCMCPKLRLTVPLLRFLHGGEYSEALDLVDLSELST